MGKLKSFTFIELLVSILLISIVVMASIKAIRYIYNSNQLNELRYLALNKLDSEMARLVFYYKNNLEGAMTTYTDWNVPFEVSYNVAGFSIYPTTASSEINASESGLNIQTQRNIVKIKNLNESNTILDNDIVGLLGWRADNNGSEVNLSISITYPYRYFNYQLIQMFKFVETINLQTSVKR